MAGLYSLYGIVSNPSIANPAWTRSARESNTPLRATPAPFTAVGRSYFIATASVVVGRPTFLQNAAKRGSSR
jgi:hypothetical protein